MVAKLKLKGIDGRAPPGVSNVRLLSYVPIVLNRRNFFPQDAVYLCYRNC